MYKVARKMHMWIGLILAVVLLIEAITGLILAEPWLVGREQQQMSPGGQPGITTDQGNNPRDKGAMVQGTKPTPTGAYGLAKGLHQGKIGNLDLKWVVDLSAIGLVILTITGIYISIPILKAQQKKR